LLCDAQQAMFDGSRRRMTSVRTTLKRPGQMLMLHGATGEETTVVSTETCLVDIIEKL